MILQILKFTFGATLVGIAVVGTKRIYFQATLQEPLRSEPRSN
jgi:hypothetical protein